MVPVGLPARDVLFNRYDDSPAKGPLAYEYGLEYGPEPTHIPRLWNISLGSWAGARQWGYQSSYDELRLPPPVIYNPSRTSIASIAMGVAAKRFADTTGVPSIFVGWNPVNARAR